jgi:hypothetical protein
MKEMCFPLFDHWAGGGEHGKPKRVFFMNRLLIILFLLVSTVPLNAQVDQPNGAQLKARAQKVVSIISSDKTKSQIYCQIAELGEEIDQEKDSKKAEALAQKVDELEKQLGPDYVSFVEATKDLDPNSKDAQDILALFDELDALCPD